MEHLDCIKMDKIMLKIELQSVRVIETYLDHLFYFHKNKAHRDDSEGQKFSGGKDLEYTYNTRAPLMFIHKRFTGWCHLPATWGQVS